MKRQLSSLLVAGIAIAISQTALADDKESVLGGTISGSTKLASDYVFRGESETADGQVPAVQASLTWTHTSTGIYAGYFGSTNKFETSPDIYAVVGPYLGKFGSIGDTGVGYNDDVVLVMFNTCKNLEAAGVVLDYMTGATTIGYMKEYGKGKMSSRMSVMAQVYSDVSDPIAAAFVDANSTNHALPCMNLHFSEADEAITRSVTRLAQCEDPATVLKDVSEEITELYAE